MRLIGHLETEKQAYAFYSFLLKEKIQNTYEEEKTDAKQYRIWVYDEDDLNAATQWLELYKKDPNDPRFAGSDLPASSSPPPPPPKYAEISQSEDLKWKSIPPPLVKPRRFSATVDEPHHPSLRHTVHLERFSRRSDHQGQGGACRRGSDDALRQSLIF